MPLLMSIGNRQHTLRGLALVLLVTDRTGMHVSRHVVVVHLPRDLHLQPAAYLCVLRIRF